MKLIRSTLLLSLFFMSTLLVFPQAKDNPKESDLYEKLQSVTDEHFKNLPRIMIKGVNMVEATAVEPNILHFTLQFELLSKEMLIALKDVIRGTILSIIKQDASFEHVCKADIILRFSFTDQNGVQAITMDFTKDDYE